MMTTIKEIAQFLGIPESDTLLLAPHAEDFQITHPAPISAAVEGEMSFCGKTAHNPEKLIAQTRASLLILDESISGNSEYIGKSELTAVLISKNARLDFMRAVKQFFERKRPVGIHTSSIIASSAVISPDVYIGPFCCIGEDSTVGSGTTIHSGVQIYDKVRIGRNVTIHSGCVIGGDGFGYERDDQGVLVKFPHIGGVLIEDDVEICGLTHVARGTLGDTIIGKGTKIDALVHVGHNIHIGNHCVITANAMLGADKIGDYSWIAPSACLRDRISVGEKATVGLGSVVTKDVSDGTTVFGSPAKENEEQKRILNHLSKVGKAKSQD
jgi:UDP-3-O-[3-hydroxymyristoyl] glucosamine N-acyltransferase